MRKRLSEMSPGERGKVARVNGSGALRRKLLDMGIVRGVSVEVLRRAPLGDPVEISVRGYNLSLRGSEAENVWVEVSSEGVKGGEEGVAAETFSGGGGESSAKRVEEEHK